MPNVTDIYVLDTGFMKIITVSVFLFLLYPWDKFCQNICNVYAILIIVDQMI